MTFVNGLTSHESQLYEQLKKREKDIIKTVHSSSILLRISFLKIEETALRFVLVNRSTIW